MSKQYTKEQHRTWSKLVKRQLTQVKSDASQYFITGLPEIGLPKSRIPDQEVMSQDIQALVGWQLVDAENEYLNAREWFNWLNKKTFPVTSYIRQPNELDFTPLPDMFHEYFGHLPFFAHQEIADLAQLFGSIAEVANERQLIEIQRLWWFSFEFGFIRENDTTKAFGAGLISSPGEFIHALSHQPLHREFNITDVINTPIAVASYNSAYFVFDSITRLRELVLVYASREGLRKDLNPKLAKHDR